MMYPRDMHYDVTDKSKTSELLMKARGKYNVRLEPIDIIDNSNDVVVWKYSFTKLLAFNQTDYERVLNLDADGMILAIRNPPTLHPYRQHRSANRSLFSTWMTFSFSHPHPSPCPERIGSLATNCQIRSSL